MGHFLHKLNNESSIQLNLDAAKTGSASLLYDGAGSRKYLTTAERKAFLRAARNLPTTGGTFCLALAYTGCRISEALNLTPRNIDFDACTITIECLKKRRRGIFRSVPVPQRFLKELDRVHRIRSAQADPATIDQPLWKFGRTTAWARVKTALTTCNISGARASPKGLRHAFGVGTLQAGVPLNLIKKWLGHSRIATTAIYADAVGDEEKSIAARFWDTF